MFSFSTISNASGSDDDSVNENSSSDNYLAKVMSQFDTSHHKKRHIVTKEEMQRRLGSPEKLSITNIEQIIRCGHRAGSGVLTKQKN